MFRNMIGVAFFNAGRLPAEKMSLRIGSKTVDPVKIHPPFRAIFDWFATHRGKRNLSSCVPYFPFFIYACFGYQFTDSPGSKVQTSIPSFSSRRLRSSGRPVRAGNVP